MGSLQVHAIKVVGPNRYEVTLADSAGTSEIAIVEVFTHKGITAARINPDLVMSSQPSPIDSRAVVAAVLAYHRTVTTAPPKARE